MLAVYLRARDVRDLVREHGSEKGTVLALERLCEENAGYRQALLEMAAQLNQALDIITKFSKAGEGIQQRIMEIERREQQYAATIDGTTVTPSGDGS